VSAVDARISALLGGLFDYAGLFPPAGLEMRETVRNYASYRAGPHARMLGRLVVPWNRRREFLDALADVRTNASTESSTGNSVDASAGDGADGIGACPVTMLIPLPDGADEVDRLRREHADFSEAAVGHVKIGALESRADAPDRLEGLPETFDLFGELFPDAEIHVEATESCPVEELLDALVAERDRTGRGAGKLRTGSVVPEEIPPVDEVVRFIRACARRDLPWKATAGLHHPLPATRALTYEADSPEGPMYGYLGVILAAARSLEDPPAPASDLRKLLTDPETPDLSAFSTTSIRTARTRGCLSIGSCSFIEPVEDARSLGLLSNSNASST